MNHSKSNDRLKILYLMDEIYSEKGGSEQHLWWLLQQLPEELVEKHLIVFSNIRHCDSASIPVRPIVLGQIHGEGIRTFHRRFFTLVKYIQENKIDLVHAFSPLDEFVAVFACKLAKQGSVVAHRRNIGYALTLKKKLMSRVTQCFKVSYIANSEAARDAAFEKEGIDPQRFELIRNPVFTRRIEDGLRRAIPRSDISAPADSPIIGIVATVRPIKGYHTFLRAAALILKQIPSAKFLIVGNMLETAYVEALQQEARNLGIENNLIWFGPIDNPFRILPHFTIAVLSSDSESFSNAALEYAACGLPTVATDVGGMKEVVIDQQTGYLVPAGDHEALSERVIALLHDPEKRNMLGENAKKYVFRQFAQEVIERQYLDFYTRVRAN